ncbi:hypothetical protein PG995_014584 [Apiospora arundinis]
MPVTFTDLPRELRDAVYKEVLFVEKPVRLIVDENPLFRGTIPEEENAPVSLYSFMSDIGEDAEERRRRLSYEYWLLMSEKKIAALPQRDDDFPDLFCDTRYHRRGTTQPFEPHKNALRVNRKIGREACEYLYANTTFVMGPDRHLDYDFINWGSSHMKGPGGICILRKFIEKIGAQNAANVRHFWVSLPGIYPWEFLGICFELRTLFPQLRTLQLADAEFPNDGVARRHQSTRFQTTGIAKWFSPQYYFHDYFKAWEKKDPKALSEFFAELTKMFACLRLIH